VSPELARCSKSIARVSPPAGCSPGLFENAREPSLIEREAAATALHSFYTGVEFILRSIADGFDGGVVKSGAWHVALLESMRSPSTHRPAVLTPVNAERLREYMVFRHRFRNMYSFDLDWALMKPLVAGMEAALNCFEADLDAFLRVVATER
jgi:hypothetical protein